MGTLIDDIALRGGIVSLGARHPAETSIVAAPVPPPSVDDGVMCERVDVERYRVLVEGHAVGFVDVAGHVFVALQGERYDHAVEIRQSLEFEVAVASLVPSH